MERSFYEKQAEIENWGVRELKRQRSSLLFQRLALSTDKNTVMKLSQKGQIIEKPEDILMSKVITVDSEYKEWIQDGGQRFKRSQIKAAIKVNDEMLRFYWSLDKDISEKGMEAKYGSGFNKMLSKDLTELMPDIRSFSVTNLKYMRYFYETFPDAQNRQQLVDDLDTI